MQPSVVVSVLNWRDPAETVACLDALLRLDYPNLHIVVSNNGDRDALDALMDDRHAGVEVRHNGRNLGYCGGNNIVLRLAIERGASYVWLFNHDAEPAPGALDRLVAVMEADPRIGLASPVLYHDDDRNKVWNAGGYFLVNQAWSHWFADADEAVAHEAAHPDQIKLAGTALLIRVAMARELGVLDERLFAYAEDADYSFRAAKLGYLRTLVRDAAVYHQHAPDAVPSAHVLYYSTRNAMLLWRWHAPPWAVFRYRFWSLASTLRACERYRQRPDLLEASLVGWWHGQLGVTGEWDPRRRVPGWVRSVLLSRWVARLTHAHAA